MDILKELESVLDMLDEIEGRVDYTGEAYPKDEYIKSGLREARHRVFKAIRAIS